jgi:hypothetical protein
MTVLRVALLLILVLFSQVLLREKALLFKELPIFLRPMLSDMFPEDSQRGCCEDIVNHLGVRPSLDLCFCEPLEQKCIKVVLDEQVEISSGHLL